MMADHIHKRPGGMRWSDMMMKFARLPKGCGPLEICG
jgi:hypothetical protein